MRTCALFVPALFVVLTWLPGCGGAPEATPAPEPEKPKLVIPPPAMPEPPEAKQKGKGIKPMADIVKGLDPDLRVDDADLPSPDGNTWMGHTSDFPKVQADINALEQYANLVLYGTREMVNRAYFNAGADFMGNPPPEQYPDYMKRNLKLAETLLGNMFGSPLPEEVKAGLESFRTAPDRRNWVKANNHVAVFVYNSRKKEITIDIK